MEPIKKTGRWIASLWKRFETRFPNVAQFSMFFILSNGVTVLQLALMPIFQRIFNQTALVEVSFQVWPVGSNADGSQFYVFNYPEGAIADGGGGGLAYFLAVEITILIAQVINFFAQRSITFKSNTSVWVAAFWYAVAFVGITILAAVAQGFYMEPIYTFLGDQFGESGLVAADFVTMIINAAISFWVFFPIFKIIFKQVPEEDEKSGAEGGLEPSENQAG